MLVCRIVISITFLCLHSLYYLSILAYIEINTLLDMIKISIPFSDEYLVTTSQAADGDVCCYVDIEECSRRGVSLEAKRVDCVGGDINSLDRYEVTDLRHPYESLPTSFTGVAFKIFQGSKLRHPCCELKASPAKILQGHNIFGGTSIAPGAIEILMTLHHSYPSLYEMLDVKNTLLDAIDCTYSARVGNENEVKQVISLLRNVSNNQLRKSLNDEYSTTCYFNKNSRHCDRKVYAKHPEFVSQLDKLRKRFDSGDSSVLPLLDVMSNPFLINYSRNLVRFEAGVKRRYLNDFGVPKKLFPAIKFQLQYEKNGNSLIADLWTKSFKPLLETFEGQKMNIFNDDEIHKELKRTFFRTTPKGNISYSKADSLYRFYRSIMADGFDSVKMSFSSRMTFSRKLKDLQSIGISKAQLQNCHGDDRSNVIPLLQVINVDFANQAPQDFEEVKIGNLSKMYGYTDNVFRLSA